MQFKFTFLINNVEVQYIGNAIGKKTGTEVTEWNKQKINHQKESIWSATQLCITNTYRNNIYYCMKTKIGTVK